MQAKVDVGLWVKPRRERIRELARKRLGATTDAALARALNLDKGGLCELLRGQRCPSGATIALFVVHLGEPFEELFEIEDLTQRAA